MGGSRALAQGWPLIAGQLVKQTGGPDLPGVTLIIGMTLSANTVAEDAASGALIGVLSDATATGTARPGLTLSNLTIAEDAASGTIVGTFS